MRPADCSRSSPPLSRENSAFPRSGSMTRRSSFRSMCMWGTATHACMLHLRFAMRWAHGQTAAVLARASHRGCHCHGDGSGSIINAFLSRKVRLLIESASGKVDLGLLVGVLDYATGLISGATPTMSQCATLARQDQRRSMDRQPTGLQA